MTNTKLLQHHLELELMEDILHRKEALFPVSVDYLNFVNPSEL